MIKPLSLLLLLFPAIGSCVVLDDHYYASNWHGHSSPVIRVEVPPASFHRRPAPRRFHGHVIPHKRHRHGLAYEQRRLPQANVHGHIGQGLVNVHGHD